MRELSCFAGGRVAIGQGRAGLPCLWGSFADEMTFWDVLVGFARLVWRGGPIRSEACFRGGNSVARLTWI